MSDTKERIVDWKPEKVEIPSGWGLNFSTVILASDEPEKYLTERFVCDDCGSQMEFFGWRAGSSYFGNRRQTVLWIARDIPLFRCNSCDFVSAPNEVFDEIERKAQIQGEELGLYPRK